MAITGSREPKAQAPEIIATRNIAIDRKTLLRKEQRQQASGMQGLKGGVEMVCQQ
jgi:hypothetical protein